MVSLNRQYPFKFFKGCLPQILLGPFLYTLSHIDFLWKVLKHAFNIFERLGFW